MESFGTALVAARHRGRRGEAGAALVEGAIVSLVLFTVLLALFDFGRAFGDYVTTADLARNAARAGSTAADDRLADFRILQSIRKSAGGFVSGAVDYVVVFDAGGPTASLPALSPTCAAGIPVTGVCNVYRAADFDRPSSQFGCRLDVPSPDRFWCPLQRRAAASAAGGGPPDHLGVYVRVDHRNFTRLTGTATALSEQAIARIEPQRA